MGLGKIKDNLGEGLYRILPEVRDYQETLLRLTEQTDLLAEQIIDKKLELAELETEPEVNKKEIRKINDDIARMELEIDALNVRINYINTGDYQDVEEIDAWCADFTVDLGGDHATVEIIREYDKNSFNIRPGYEGRSTYDIERDGYLDPPLLNTPTAAYNNFVWHPGYQRWKPIYRYAFLTEINYSDDTCRLTFEDVKSKSCPWAIVNNYPGLPISTFDVPDPVWIPIEYMDCNAEPFNVDDSVIVEFPTQEWEDAKVIGYKSHPQPCGSNLWWVRESDPVAPNDIYDFIHIAVEPENAIPKTPEPDQKNVLMLTGPARVGTGEKWDGVYDSEYVITAICLSKMTSVLPAEIISKLNDLKDIKYASYELLEAALIAKLGLEDATAYKGTIRKFSYSPFVNSPLINRASCFKLLDNKIVPGMKISLIQDEVEKKYTYYHTSCISGGTVKALNYRLAGHDTSVSCRYIVEIHGRNMMCASSDRIQYKVGDWVFVAYPRNQNHTGADQTRTEATRRGIATRIIEQINLLRKAAGVQPVVACAKLTEAAMRHSQDMSANCFCGHEGSDGSTELNRIEDTGMLRQNIIENIDVSQIDPTSDDVYDPFESEIFTAGTGEILTYATDIDKAIDNWQLSPNHLKLILLERLTFAGVGVERIEKESVCTVMSGTEKKIKIMAEAGSYIEGIGYISSDQEVFLDYKTWYAVTVNFADTVSHYSELMPPKHWFDGANDGFPFYKPTAWYPSEWISEINAVSYPELAEYGYMTPNANPSEFPVILPLQIGADFAESQTVHNRIVYANTETGLRELRNTVIINAKIMRIHRELLVGDSEAVVVADLKTIEYGTDTFIENVPFFYHIEGSYPENHRDGHKAFKVYDEVLLLIKDARGSAEPLTDLEKYIVGFADGFPRKAMSSYFVFRTRKFEYNWYATWGDYNYSGFCPNNVWNPFDYCLVWDVEKDEVYQDIKKWNAVTGKYEDSISFPMPYSELYQDTDFFKKHALVSDCPGIGVMNRHAEFEWYNIEFNLIWGGVPFPPQGTDPLHWNIVSTIPVNCWIYIGTYLEGSGLDIYWYEDYPSKAAGWYHLGDNQRKMHYRPLCRAFEFKCEKNIYTVGYPYRIPTDTINNDKNYNSPFISATSIDYIDSPGYQLYTGPDPDDIMYVPFAFCANNFTPSYTGPKIYNYLGVYANDTDAGTDAKWYGEDYALERNDVDDDGCSFLLGPTYVLAVDCVSQALIDRHIVRYQNIQVDCAGTLHTGDHSGQCNFGKIFSNHYPEIIPEDRVGFITSQDLSANFIAAYKAMFAKYWTENTGVEYTNKDTPVYGYD